MHVHLLTHLICCVLYIYHSPLHSNTMYRYHHHKFFKYSSLSHCSVSFHHTPTINPPSPPIECHKQAPYHFPLSLIRYCPQTRTSSPYYGMHIKLMRDANGDRKLRLISPHRLLCFLQFFLLLLLFLTIMTCQSRYR